ncbi:MAG: hypothetical protein PGN33_14185 [Methylobacterium radiotolerans]
MTRTQFIVAMATHIARAGGLTARDALPRASEAYQAFEGDCGVTFGDPGYAWNEDAARIVATEYEVANW